MPGGLLLIQVLHEFHGAELHCTCQYHVNCLGTLSGKPRLKISLTRGEQLQHNYLLVLAKTYHTSGWHDGSEDRFFV